MAKKIKQTPSTQLSVIAEGRDEWGRRYFRLGERGEPLQLRPVLATRLVNQPKEVMASLANIGVSLFTGMAQREFIASVQKWKPEQPSFKVATRIGWNDDSYVLPDRIFNRRPNIYPVLDELRASMMAKYREAEDYFLEEWQENIGKLCVGNSRLMFAVALAFTGPILRFADELSGGFQIFGRPETGKSTAAMVAGSVWGCHTQPDLGFLESWNTTAAEAEITALAHNDGLLILDETKKAGATDAKRAEVIMDVIMRLAEQQEKKRHKHESEYRSWRCCFLSTSNFSLNELATRARVEIDDAVRGRLVDIPLPNTGYGIYEDLHDFPTGSELTEHLKMRCRVYYGIVIRYFLARLLRGIQRGRVDALKRGLKELRQEYLDELRKRLVSEKPLERASSRFATVYAAGAIGYTPWNA
jgi:putative DNA primase/helicase